MNRSFEILDVTLRDGSHAMRHSFTEKQVEETARGLDKAGVSYFEVSHGDGLGGSLYNQISKVNELKLIEAAYSVCSRASKSIGPTYSRYRNKR